MAFHKLAEEAERYKGKTVILGGYIIETRNVDESTIIEVLQAPLGMQDKPESKDFSQGRLIISYDGFLDPYVYSKDRQITVAGTLTDCTIDKVATCWIESREIHLWREYNYPYPYDYYPGEPVLRPYYRGYGSPRYDPYR